MTPQEAEAALSELSQVHLVRRCERTEYVLIRGFLKWNPIDNANVGKARMKELSSIPTTFTHWTDLLAEIDRFGGEHLTLPQTLRERVTERVTETGPNSEPNRTDPNGPEGNRADPTQKPPPRARAREAAAREAAQPRSVDPPKGNGDAVPPPPEFQEMMERDREAHRRKARTQQTALENARESLEE